MANQFTLKNGGYEPFIGNYGLVPQPPIPEPDAEDNGKVLGVSEGQYALVSGGGGASGMVVETIVTETESNMYVTIQKTAKELFDLSKSGIAIIVHSGGENQGEMCLLIGNAIFDVNTGYHFAVIQGNTFLDFVADDDDEYPEYGMPK